MSSNSISSSKCSNNTELIIIQLLLNLITQLITQIVIQIPTIITLRCPAYLVIQVTYTSVLTIIIMDRTVLRTTKQSVTDKFTE